ncbi:MAG: DegV family protein [Anaerolineae bacterium]
MTQIALVTDTTVNMTEDLLKRYGITMVPVHVIFDGVSYKEIVDMPIAEFYRRLIEIKAAGGALPTSSQPSPGELAEAYLALAAQGATDIISIHVSAVSSGTCNSAMLAREMVQDKVRVHVVDSASTSMHMGYMLIEAHQVIQRQGTVEEALAAIDRVKAHSGIFFTVTELDHLEASGRTTGTGKVLEASIKVRPVIGLVAGKPTVLSPERTQRAAIDKVIELIRERLKGCTIKGVTVVHGNSPLVAEVLKARAPQELGYAGEVLIADFGAGLGVHFGPGLLGLAAYGEPVA